MIELTEEQAKDLLWEGMAPHSENTGVVLEKVWEDDWQDDGKYSHKSLVFTDNKANYILHLSKSGSYFSDYYYDFTLKCPKVRKTTKMVEIIEWVKE